MWAYALACDTTVILLDEEPNHNDLNSEIRRAIETDGDAPITDFHIRPVGVAKLAAIIFITAHEPQTGTEKCAKWASRLWNCVRRTGDCVLFIVNPFSPTRGGAQLPYPKKVSAPMHGNKCWIERPAGYDHSGGHREF